jgi:hypothetical protein
MPFASLPMLIAASPALVAMLFIPLASATPQAVVARTVAAYVSYRPTESRVSAARVQTARRPAAASQPFAVSIAAAQRRLVALSRPNRASALFSLFLPFPNAPRAP